MLSRLPLILLLLLCAVSLTAQTPVITSQPVNLTVTSGRTATFSVTASGGYRYQWQRDGSNTIAGATSSSYTFTPTVADTGHIFNVLVYAANGAAAASGSGWLHVVPRTDAPTVTSVENFGMNTASQAADSFGLGVDSAQPWEFAAVANMGGRWIRADGCQWEHIEVQVMPGNSSGGFAPALSPECLMEVTSAAQNGLHLDALSYFAPPSSQIATAVVASAVPAGARSLPLRLLTGTLSGYEAQEMLVFGASGLNSRIDYGAPVLSVSGTTLTLPEPSIAAIPAGTQVTVNVLLYAPVLIAPGSKPTAYVSDPSVTAWLAYIHAVETFMQSENVTGAVELWNEPEQSNELWDDAALFYATPPANFTIGNSGLALAFAAGTLPAVPGVRLLNGWTDLSGGSSVYNPAFSSFLPVSAAQMNTVFLGESQHPYGNNPEQQSWLPAVVQADAAQGVQEVFSETPIGGQVGANFKSQPWYSSLPSALGGIQPAVTETGLQMGLNAEETELQRARFDLRQFLTMTGNKVYPVIFYKAGNAPGWEWFGEDSGHTPHLVVAAFTSLLRDINEVAKAPVTAYTSASLPQVTSYQGYYPLATMNLVGSSAGASSNSVLFYAWQKSYTVPPAGTTTDENYGAAAAWTTLASPVAVPVQVTVPAGSSVSYVKDLVTGSAIPFTVAGNVVTYAVTDNPAELLFIPAPARVATVNVADTSVLYGSASSVVSATVTYSAGSRPTGAFGFTVGSVSSGTGVCAVSTTTEVCTATENTKNWTAGTYAIVGTLTADTSYGSVASAGQLIVAPSTPTLSVANVTASLPGNSVSLTASVGYAGTLPPTGGVSFRVGSLAAVAATCSRSASPMLCTASYPLAPVPAGASTMTVNLASDNNYHAASSTATLNVGSSATIVAGNVSADYGTLSVTLTASVAYKGSSPGNSISFQVAGGPAINATCTGTGSPLSCSATYSPHALLPGAYPVTAAASLPQWTTTGTAGSLVIGQAKATLSVANETLASNAASTTLFVNVIFAGPVVPTGAVTFQIDGGTPMVAHYTGSGTSPRTAIATGKVAGLSVGRHTVTSSVAADGLYQVTTGTAALTIFQAQPVP